MLATFQNRTVRLMRLTTVSGNRRSYNTVMSADCDIQNVADKYFDGLGQTGQKTYMAWFDIDTDVREGDVMRDTLNNVQYRVVAVEKHGEGMGLESEHLEVQLTRHTS